MSQIINIHGLETPCFSTREAGPALLYECKPFVKKICIR